MNNRRRFITLVPFAGAALLAACSKEAASPSASQAPSPMAPPAPAPATPAPTAAPPAAGTDSAAVSGTTLPLVQESEPAAVALGYVNVASKADSSKYKNYTAGQACSNCSLYGGKGGEAQAPCPLFAGKHVLATAWCSAYVKKAA